MDRPPARWGLAALMPPASSSSATTVFYVRGGPRRGCGGREARLSYFSAWSYPHAASAGRRTRRRVGQQPGRVGMVDLVEHVRGEFQAAQQRRALAAVGEVIRVGNGAGSLPAALPKGALAP